MSQEKITALAEPVGEGNFYNLLVTNALAVEPQLVIPLTGATITCTKPYVIIKPAATIATLTITLPGAPLNGQVLTIYSSQIITSVTTAGGTLDTALTTFGSAKTKFKYIFEQSTNTWYSV